jgi:uncharacterized lipoprotein YddW (UPF0748 family)
VKQIFGLLLSFLVFSTLILPPAQAQTEPAPLYEVRGAWLTTVWRLDWPPQGTSQFQQQRLREIIQHMKALGMNTVIFQVVSHGEAMYPSERLPRANWLTGTPGGDPGYDPLALAIEEAHSLGMELHAWFNVNHVAAPTSNISPTVEPVHVRFAHPEWVVQHTDNTWWGNSGIPAFRQWQVDNVLEIVRNYEIDAIHFDYMRYPAREGLPGDVQTRQQYPNTGTTIENWRRENINLFVREVYAAVKAEKAWVKVGSAPIGAYRWFSGAPPGYWAFDDVYQEGQRWMAEGIMDYVAPQLYFTIGTAPLPPNTYNSQDFAHWTRNWLANRNGRHVYIGQGTWLETAERRFPAGEITSQIGLTRRENAHGQVHFRYAHTTGAPFGGQYQRPSLPPPMSFLPNAEAPSEPPGLTITFTEATNTITLSWQAATPAAEDPLRRYAIFRRSGETPDVSEALDLVGYVGAGQTTWTEVFPVRPEAAVEYVVAAQSLLGMLSAPSNIVSTSETALNVPGESLNAASRLHAPYPNPVAGDQVELQFDLGGAGDITLRLFDVLGREVEHLASGHYSAGTHRIELDGSRYVPGMYLIELVAGPVREVQRLVIIR